MRHRAIHSKKLAAYSVLVILLLVFPMLMRKDPFILHIAIMSMFGAIFGLGFRLVFLTGHLSIGQSLFTAVGAYISVLLVMKLGFSFWLSLPLAGIASALFGLVIGTPALRLKGPYFAILTFGLGEVGRLFLINWSEVTGGEGGIARIPPPDPIIIIGWPALQFTIIDKTSYYYLVLTLLVITVVVMRRLDNSRIGDTIGAIAQSDSLAESLGINVAKYNILAFTIACFFTGLGGASYAHYIMSICPTDFTFWQSVDYLIYAFVGGTANVLGPIMGATLLIVLSNLIASLAEYDLLFYSILLMVVVFFLPEGLLGLRHYLPTFVTGIHRLRKLSMKGA